MPDKIIIGSTIGGAFAGAILTLFGIKKTMQKELKDCFAAEAASIHRDINRQQEEIKHLQKSCLTVDNHKLQCGFNEKNINLKIESIKQHIDSKIELVLNKIKA